MNSKRSSCSCGSGVRPLVVNGLFLALTVALTLNHCIIIQHCEAYYQRDVFKELVLNDNTNDDAINMGTLELIKRSGYEYEEHFVIADDGYVTQLVHLINPLADRLQLKSPPVLLFHGANIDNSAYVLTSSIQHHPEKYPRTFEADGPITSSNRSLAFMLANNGHDVWLMSTRGSNQESQAFVKDVAAAREQVDFKPNATDYDLINKDRKKYWSYGLDEIIEFELKVQIDKVRHLSGHDEVSILSFSLSTPTTMVFLAQNPDYARKVRVYTQIAPAIAADHFTTLDRIYFEKLCPKFPTRGLGFAPTYLITPFVGKAVMKLSKYKKIRYSFIYAFITALFGPSLKYQTNIERNFLARVFRPVSFKSIKHYCQNSVSKRLQKFDYGKKGNLAKYGEESPALYQVDRLEVQNWVVVAGTYDALADPTTIQRLIETTKTPLPVTLIMALGFNHADFLAAVENDKYVNLPVLAELDKHSQL